MRKANKRELSFETLRFAAVGVVNTLIDFGVLNILVAVVGFAAIPANIVSVSVAMTFSFFANRMFVFHSKDTSYRRQGLQFILVTAFGLYVLQTGVIHLFVNIWSEPFVWVASWFTLFEEDFIIVNGAKAAATAVTLVWNFVFYKFLVFKD